MPLAGWNEHTQAAVESILEQSHRALELLVITKNDPAALDDARARLPEDPRIRIVPRQSAGIVGALNTGLATARSPWIARMDADDIAHRDRLATQLDFLKSSPAISIAATEIRMIDAAGGSDGISDGNRRYAAWLNELKTPEAINTSIFVECPMPHPTWLAHRSTWWQLGSYRDFDGPEDYDWILRAWLRGLQMGKPDGVLLDWREHDDRLTWKNPRYRPEAFTRCRADIITHPAAGFGLDRGRGVWIGGTGRNARYWCDALLARNVLVRGFIDLDREKPLTRKRHLPVITWSEIDARRGDDLVITAIRDKDARTQLKADLLARGWEANREFVLGG